MPHSQQAQALQQLQGHPVSKEIRRMCHSNASNASVASSRQGVPPPPPAAAYPWPEVGPGGTWRDVAGDCWNLRRKVWKVCQKAQQLHQILEQDSESHHMTT